MEAARFGFGPATPPAFKFDPTDADIVAFYLLPRALNLPSPFAHAVIDDDPASLPPWDLLEKHNHGSSLHAFFFGPHTDMAKNGGRKERAVKGGSGGMWRGQKSVVGNLTLLGPGGGEVDIKYKRYDLTYKCEGKKTKGTSGWVMHEYEILSPPLHGALLSRIKVTGKRKKELQQAQAQALVPAVAVDQHQQVFPVPELPDPSYHPDVMGEVFPVPEHPDPSYYPAVPDPEQPGPSYHRVVMGAGGEGFSDGQTDTPYYCDNDGGMGEAGGYYVDLFCAGEGVGNNMHYNNGDFHLSGVDFNRY